MNFVIVGMDQLVLNWQVLAEMKNVSPKDYPDKDFF
jgi:hypothetical protein